MKELMREKISVNGVQLSLGQILGIAQSMLVDQYTGEESPWNWETFQNLGNPDYNILKEDRPDHPNSSQVER